MLLVLINLQIISEYSLYIIYSHCRVHLRSFCIDHVENKQFNRDQLVYNNQHLDDKDMEKCYYKQKCLINK